jgi:hypothetical protein
MADPESLKRLGGGRWQTRDGRFTVEPQSGTWVVVDDERTDELGLPLVRGPFGSLTAAKADIEVARAEGVSASPLASRIAAGPKRREAAKGAGATPSGRAPKPPVRAERAPDEPAWLRGLDGPGRERARRLLARLSKEGVDDAEALVRSDLVGGQPGLARLAITRAVKAAVGRRTSPDVVAQAVAEALLDGRDGELGVSWRLVDGDGRPVRRLDRDGGSADRRD